MSDARKRRFALVLSASAVLLAVVFWLYGRPAMADFEVNVKAGGRLLAGETLYRTADEHWQFKYSPFSALIYLPLSLLPLTAAKAVWFFAVAAAIAAIVILSRRLPLAGGPPPPLAVVMASVVMAKLFLRELQLGQINALITVFLLLMALALRARPRRAAAGTDLLAGLAWGLATALKPYAVIFLPYFILRGKLRALLSGLAFVGLSLVVPAAFYGFRGLGAVLGEWAATLSRSTPALFDTQDNVSLLGLLAKWTGDIPLSTVLYAVSTGILALLTLAAVFRGRKMDDPVPLEAGLLLLFIPLISPLGWDYTFLSGFLAVLIVFRHWARFPAPGRVFLAANAAMIGLALYDLLGRSVYARFMALSIPTLNFLAVAAALFYLRAKKAA